MKIHTVKAPAILVGAAFLFALALSPSANSSSLRQGQGPSGTAGAVTGALPGEVLWTYFQTFNSLGQFCPPGPGPEPFEDVLCNTEGEGDNIIRLINPNGAANGNLAGAKSQTVCAMIYVFDDDEEMGECCGCPLSSAQLATFSVDQNLTSNWGIPGEPGILISAENAYGAIAIVAAPQNAPVSLVPGLNNGQGCTSTQSGACNFGCDPTNTPGYSVTNASNLLGSITHDQSAQAGPLFNEDVTDEEITETALSDDSGGDPTNLIYLQNQCGALVGNGTGGGICNCPIE